MFHIDTPNEYHLRSEEKTGTYKNGGEADSGLLHFSLLLITSKSQRRFLVKSEEVKVKVPKTYAFGTLCLLHEYTTTGKAPFRMYIRFVFS